MADFIDTAELATIEIELDGKTHVLTPSLNACIAISNMSGGLTAAAQKCNQLDMNTICAIIAAGLNLNPTQAKMVPKAVFATGLFTLSGPCIDFINIVGNGGRPIRDDEEEEPDADPLKPASL